MKNVKVKVTMKFDIPMDENGRVYKYDSRGFVIQTVFDGVTNYALCRHLEDANRWLSKAKGNKKSIEYMIYKNHNEWADILEKSKSNIEIMN